jgi:acyl-coenzyme A thioesterase PaaI-like protein
MSVEREGPFWDVMQGRKPPPPAATTLGFQLLEIDPERGTIRVQFLAGELTTEQGELVATATATARIVKTT